MRRVAMSAVLAFCTGLVLIALAGPRLLGKSQSDIQRDRRTARYRLEYGFRNVVRGRVTDDRGKPVANVTVSARFAMHQTGMVGENDAVTDRDGRYEIRALGDKDFMVGVDVRATPYLVPLPQRATLTKRGTTVTRDFVLSRGPRVSVRVVDAETGKPVPGLAVYSGLYVMTNDPIGRTDADGRFTWTSNTLKFEIRLGDPNDSASREAIGAAPGYEFYRQVDLPTSRSYLWETKAYRRPFDPVDTTFRGVVTDEKGTPLPNARVRIVQYSDTKETRTDTKGHFKIDGKRVRSLDEGKIDAISILVDADDRSATLWPKAEETWNEMRIVAKPKSLAEATGKVVDENGRPAVGVPVDYNEYFVGGMAGGGIGGVTDAAGRFVVQGLRPGAQISLHLGRGDWGVAHVPATWPRGASLVLLPGERRDLGTLMVPHAPAVVAGRVLDQSGKPEARPTTLTLKGAHTDLNVSTGKDGSFRFTGVVLEPLTLRAFAASDNGASIGDDSSDQLLSRAVSAGDTSVRAVVKWRQPHH